MAAVLSMAPGMQRQKQGHMGVSAVISVRGNDFDQGNLGFKDLLASGYILQVELKGCLFRYNIESEEKKSQK